MLQCASTGMFSVPSLSVTAVRHHRERSGTRRTVLRALRGTGVKIHFRTPDCYDTLCSTITTTQSTLLGPIRGLHPKPLDRQAHRS